MVWFIFALLAALSVSTRDVFSKKALFKTNEYVAAFSMRLFALPFLLPLIFFIELAADMLFWYILPVWGLLNLVASILYMKAIKISPLSLAIPMLAFTPVFMLITSPLILGEFPTFFGLIGILLVVVGSYILHIKDVKKGFFAPFKALVSEKGCILMLIVAFIFSISANLDKILVTHSGPVFYAIAGNLLLALLLLPFIFRVRKKPGKARIRDLVPIGFFTALMFLFQMYAIQFTLAVYVIAIKRTSGIFSTLYGKYVFKEIRIKERMLGVIIMVLGVLFITLL